MLRKLSTHKFRGLGDFTMDGLGRVNLLVGSNNCGKTTVLEAVHFLLGAGDPAVLWSTLSERSEDLSGPPSQEMDVSHLFEGHEIHVESTFRVTGMNDAGALILTAEIVDVPPPGNLALALRWSSGGSLDLPLSELGGLNARDVRAGRQRPERDDARPIELITTGALSEYDTVSHLEEVVLTENEDLLIRALQSIEAGIERIAPVGSKRRLTGVGGRGGVVVKLAGVNKRIPLGSMGDGMWRMLGIALSLVRAKGGVLLIDEIDTGLHYTVMEEMWRLVHDAAKRFDVQVFATTHSSDCYRSLAAIVQAESQPRPEVTIQRIERGNPHAVAFTDEEIAIAAKIGAEVR